MNAVAWVTASEVARHLGVVKDTVYHWRERKGCLHTRSAGFGNSSCERSMTGCMRAVPRKSEGANQN